MYCVAAAAVGQSSFAVVLGLQLRRIIIHRTQQGVRLPMASGISGAWKEAPDTMFQHPNGHMHCIWLAKDS